MNAQIFQRKYFQRIPSEVLSRGTVKLRIKPSSVEILDCSRTSFQDFKGMHDC